MAAFTAIRDTDGCMIAWGGMTDLAGTANFDVIRLAGDRPRGGAVARRAVVRGQDMANTLASGDDTIVTGRAPTGADQLCMVHRTQRTPRRSGMAGGAIGRGGHVRRTLARCDSTAMTERTRGARHDLRVIEGGQERVPQAGGLLVTEFAQIGRRRMVRRFIGQVTAYAVV